ncbi:PAS domain S-box protein [Bacillus sp. CGMCC 1.16541]|uniref:PAS domain S-box protein n=1 Tax=Bacillus sp. CGMCC 1.16541 TaxID=2185143 RepID=UPI000D732A49|nr:PAS domain S-box protein [Bacillus sp. CGMCC 1.16541]
MNKHASNHQHNILLFKTFWCFYFFHTLSYKVIDSQPTPISPLVGLLMMTVLSAFIYFHIHPSVTMYTFIFFYYLYMAYLNIIEPEIVNYIFLFLGIIISVIYQSYRLIFTSTVLSLSLLWYLYERSFTIMKADITEADLIYFLLFAVFIMLFVLYYTKFTKSLWTVTKMKINEQETELHSSQEYLQSFFTYNNDAISVFSVDGKVISVNPAFERTYGWMKEEIVGLEMPFIPEPLKKSAFDRFERVRSGESMISFETQDVHKDGHFIDVEITLSPIYDQKQTVIALSAIARDITEKKETKEFLRRTDKLSLAGEMAAGVAHEIRNPLTSLQGFVQLIDEKSPEHHMYTSIMKSEIKRIDGIVNEFLMLAKPQPVSMKPHLFRGILNDVILLFETECALKNVLIDVRMNIRDTQLMCDANQLKQVFINLLKNAIEAMPNGGLISISVTHYENELVITIQDSGEGIPSHMIKHIDKPFFTTKEYGTGLGLLITKDILKQHHGSMTIESKEKHGTTIELRLPLIPSAVLSL